MIRTYPAFIAAAALLVGTAYADTTSAAQQVTNAIVVAVAVAVCGGAGSGFTSNLGVSSKPCDARNDVAVLFTTGKEMGNQQLVMAEAHVIADRVVAMD